MHDRRTCTPVANHSEDNGVEGRPRKEANLKGSEETEKVQMNVPLWLASY